jgi:hypothetical protein
MGIRSHMPVSLPARHHVASGMGAAAWPSPPPSRQILSATRTTAMRIRAKDKEKPMPFAALHLTLAS